MQQVQLDQIVSQQMKFWVSSTLFASAYALFAKLIWTHKFPILIFLPILMIVFAIGSIGSLRKQLAQEVQDSSAASSSDSDSNEG